MIAFYYDDTFEGLLSVVFDAYTLKKFPDAILGGNDVPPLTISDFHVVTTERHKADRVFAGLGRRLTKTGKNTVLLAFLSEQEQTPTLLFRYMRKVLDSPHPVDTDFADPDILVVDQLAKKVSGESHLLKGFTRFQKTAEGIYFAVISPRYNTLTLLLPHFKERFAIHRWILYDAKRRYGFFHDLGKLHEVCLDPALVNDGKLAAHLLAEDEFVFQKAWQTYFTATTITERLNLKLQARCLPRRFWSFMTEMQTSPRKSNL